MDFDQLASLFHEVGVAPNTTDQKCALWIADRSLGPLITLLRTPAEKANAVKLLNYCDEFTTVARADFNIIEPLRDAISLMDSLRVLCAIGNGPSPAMHKPSSVREALDFIGTIDKNSMVGLAIQRGDLGRYVRSVAERFVTISSKDVVAQERLRSAHNWLNGEVKVRGESIDLGCAALLDITQGVAALTAASMEEMVPVLEGIFEFVDRRIQHAERLTFDCADKEFVDMAVAVVQQLRAGHATSEIASANIAGQPDLEKQAPAKKSLFLVFLEDTLVEQFVPCFLNVLNGFEQGATCLMDFMQAAEKMMEKVRIAFGESGVQTDFVKSKAPSSHHMQEKFDIMRQLMEVLACSMCFSSEMSRHDFKGVLDEWGAWQRTGEDSRRSEPRSRPVLDLILKGAHSATNVDQLLKNHGDIGKERIDGLVMSIKAGGILDIFSKVSADLIGETLLHVHAGSFLEAVMPQDLRTISKAGNFDYTLNIAKLLIGSPRSQGDDSWTAAFDIVKALPDHGSELKIVLPHHKPIALAKNCVNLLAADSEVSCSGACRKHECACLGCGVGSSG